MFKWFKRAYSLPVIIGTFGVALLLSAVFLFVIMTSFPRLPAEIPDAVLAVTPPASATAYLPTLTPTTQPTQTPGLPPSPLPGFIGVGGYVQIFGTDGDALNIRSEAGLGGEIFFYGFDAELFYVGDGPVEKDGITWWYLVTPVDESRAGWAAANYLSPVSSP